MVEILVAKFALEKFRLSSACTGLHTTTHSNNSFSVAVWIGGFDIIYSCQDHEFDLKQGLHSIPQRFGIRNALLCARIAHGLTSVSLLVLGLLLNLGFPFYIGWLITTGLLVYENSLVSPRDLSKLNMAFFNINGYIAVIIFGFTFASIYF